MLPTEAERMAPMKRSRRMLSLFLLLALLLPACGQSKPNPADTTTAAVGTTAPAAPVEETTTEDPNDRSNVRDSLPDGLNFDGETIRVLYRGSGNGLIELLELTGTDNVGDYVTDSVWERDRKVEERLGVVFDFVPSNTGTLAEMSAMVRSIVASASDEYDYINSTGNSSITQSLNQYLRDLSGLPYVNYEEPWWWIDAIRAVSLDGKTYNYIFGDMCLYCYVQTGAFFYNKALYADFFGDADEMYSYVLDGTWTIDLLREKTAAAYKDANGNGTADTDDIFGMEIAGVQTQLEHFLEGCALDLYHYDENNHLVIEFDTDRALLAVEKLTDLFHNTEGSYSAGFDIDTGDVPFASGNYLFFPSRIRRVLNDPLRNMEAEYGILPYPKLEADQKEYRSLIHNSGTTIFVPKSVSDAKMEAVGATFEALCAESYRSVMPLFLDTALKVKYSRDAMSGQVIDIVIGSVAKNTLHEYENYTASIFINCLVNPIRNNNNNFASAYAKSAPAAQKTWNKSTDKFSS